LQKYSSNFATLAGASRWTAEMKSSAIKFAKRNWPRCRTRSGSVTRKSRLGRSRPGGVAARIYRPCRLPNLAKRFAPRLRKKWERHKYENQTGHGGGLYLGKRGSIIKFARAKCG